MNRWVSISLFLLVWAIAATTAAAWLWTRGCPAASPAEGGNISVSLGVGFGNGTVLWFNGTEVRSGSTLLEATESVLEVNYTVYPGMGAFVQSIGGVENSDPMYWMWWTWTDWGGWQEGPVAADRYVVADGEVLFWLYENASASPLPTPPGG